MKYRSLLFTALASACDSSPVIEETATSALDSRATTVVSLTFDDTLDNHFEAAAMLAARNMRGTFYVNSPRFGTSGYLTLDEALQMQDAGHEIGGHTLDHTRLTQVSSAEAKYEICNDRAALMDEGFVVTSFAFPFGADNASVQQLVNDCGYNSARDVGGLACSGCPYANAIPPATPYMLRTNDSVDTETTLAMMQQSVTQAEQTGGGFVPIVFHHVCDNCGEPQAITPALLGQFLDWLAARAPATQVATVDEVIGGAVRPKVTVPPPGSEPPPASNLIRNPSLETDADGNQVPDCWQRGGFGTNTSSYALVSDASDGVRAQRITISSYTSGGRRLLTAQDSGTCAPAVTAGKTYRVTAFYKSTTAPRFTIYTRNASGTWAYFAESPLQPTSSTYRQATYTTPAMPSGATAISVALTIYGVGTITMDQFSLVDTAAPPPDTTPPALAIQCNGTTCATTAYTSPVTVSLTASDASGIREIRYTTDGSDPTTGTLYTAPFTISATTTVRATAVDNAGLRTFAATTIAINSQPPPDTTPPALAIQCNGAACSTTAYPGPVTVSLTATDASGVRELRYTTDGSNPNNGTLYTAPFTVSATSTVRATAVDNANNRTSLTQAITIASQPPPDTTPPALAIQCNGSTCATTAYPNPVTVSLVASDASGIQEIRYTTDGSDPTTGTPYTAPFVVSTTTTVRATAVDNAGNRTNQTATITIGQPPPDATPPTLAIQCNSTTCATTAYPSPVTVSLVASDASGIQEIRYTTDGSDPATGTLYTAPFSVSATTTVRATAVDNAGNRTNQTATITIAQPPPDTTPPTLAIQCNGTSCAATYTAPVTVSLVASDASGIREIRYSTDGSDPTTGTLYTAPFTVSATTTVRATAVDNADNRTDQSATITIVQAPTNLLQNASLETDADGNQIPDCWKRDGYGTNSATYTIVADAFDGARAQRIDITSWTSGGRRLASAQDAGACAPAVTPGRRYTMTAYYKSTIAPKFSVFYRNSAGSWVWLAESASLPISSTYRQATFSSPAMPAGATAISIGLSIFGVGSITTDAYTLREAP